VISVRLHSWAALQGEGARAAHLAAAMEEALHNGSGIVLSDQLQRRRAARAAAVSASSAGGC
jgi:hypothetical protein